MAHEPEMEIDSLWFEYGKIFREFDDLTLARWMAQTLGHLHGHVWRLSHPLVACYRLAAQVGHERQIWLKRLVAVPADYPESACCSAPTLPLLTRDVLQCGLSCIHCNETAICLDELPDDLHSMLREWAREYEQVHNVAHWEKDRQRRVPDYNQVLEEAATKTEGLLAFAGRQLAPKLLELYPAVIWEDQDECLEVRPEDVKM
ncbi:MAG: hypothetical protein N3G20_04245 [Verrucomicrobiae bacterium]|nr:hypothetical protein [Verrucomicrobiae bacterium]